MNFWKYAFLINRVRKAYVEQCFPCRNRLNEWHKEEQTLILITEFIIKTVTGKPSFSVIFITMVIKALTRSLIVFIHIPAISKVESLFQFHLPPLPSSAYWGCLSMVSYFVLNIFRIKNIWLNVNSFLLAVYSVKNVHFPA